MTSTASLAQWLSKRNHNTEVAGSIRGKRAIFFVEDARERMGGRGAKKGAKERVAKGTWAKVTSGVRNIDGVK